MHSPDCGHSISGGTTTCFNRTLPILSKKLLYMTLLTTSRRFWILRVFGKKELAKFTWLGSVRCFPRRGPFFERLGYLPDLE